MNSDVTISLVLSALNEEKRFSIAISDFDSSLQRVTPGANWEYILINDGSKDSTPKLMNELAQNRKNVRVIHHEKPMGIGYSYRQGIQIAQGTHVVLGFCDAPCDSKELDRFFSRIGEADMTISYIVNLAQIKNRLRYFLSRSFTFIVNTTFGHSLTYYNGLSSFKRKALQQIPIKSKRFAAHTEIIVRLLANRSTFVEVGMTQNVYGRQLSQAVRPKSIADVLRTLVHLVNDLKVRRKPKRTSI